MLPGKKKVQLSLYADAREYPVVRSAHRPAMLRAQDHLSTIGSLSPFGLCV